MGKCRVADRANLSVAPYQGTQELVVGLVELIVEKCDCDVILVPTKTRIIKVDDVQPFSVNDKYCPDEGRRESDCRSPRLYPTIEAPHEYAVATYRSKLAG